jgi:preprotein translocase subunit SecG
MLILFAILSNGYKNYHRRLAYLFTIVFFRNSIALSLTLIASFDDVRESEALLTDQQP